MWLDFIQFHRNEARRKGMKGNFCKFLHELSNEICDCESFLHLHALQTHVNPLAYENDAWSLFQWTQSSSWEKATFVLKLEQLL